LLDACIAACLIDRMILEKVLKPDFCYVADGSLPLLVIFDDHHFGISTP
jgi:hypothetical protein